MDASDASEQAPAKKGKGSRPRSEVAFPYYNLDSAVEVAEKIHGAGGSCTREQLAPIIGYSGVKNGGFLSRLGAARMFGLVDEVGGMVRPSQLAITIYAPVQATDAQRAKVEAFLNIELFRKIYERFKGQPLPTPQGLQNLLKNDFKVVPAQIKNALRTMQESAESAGFFNAAGRGRLVLPLAANAQTISPTSISSHQVSPETVNTATAPDMSEKQEATSGRYALTDLEGIPPAIYGLIRDLPAEGTAMSSSKRTRLIKAFEASVNWLYPDEEEAADED